MEPISRRDALGLGATGLVLSGLVRRSPAASPPTGRTDDDGSRRPFLTPGDDFTDVSRGDPIPHTLQGEALVKARLTPETWRLEVAAEGKAELAKPLRQADGSAIDLASLVKLGETKGVLFLKAMQCNNIAQPLGQGLWEGVPLRDVLRLGGEMKQVRRVYYWGFHNNDPKQMFRSSLAINQVLDAPPGELPPFIAYRLNGGPIPLERGGPVRMIVPWAHGFKSVKWLQQIVLTNDYQANDTYALANNDPESYLKTAAYLDDADEATRPAGETLVIRGTAMVGWPGLARVESWLRRVSRPVVELHDDDPAWATASWRPCDLDPPPVDLAAELPAGVDLARIWGFGPDGRPKEWPLRFSVAPWSASLGGLEPGDYEFRVRTVDRNGFAQPEPRPFAQRSGVNGVQCKRLHITAKA
ncbi:molybdopterin-dependent oxidoreductase [Paludisphaera borealis]|uniref:Sulfoxide reductase catalytic subunit YedY n=1 Tax=Paludisphaera borealis TaxID=1387353 RepID=A0A1U7CRA9_9BACT|nr:molybdopterin-dependent oxidoreductase [Paludisphaera borealis]APW61477.1 Sulfoxide reductase catalytic subunit YedY [Paludisphaera borealis]